MAFVSTEETQDGRRWHCEGLRRQGSPVGRAFDDDGNSFAAIVAVSIDAAEQYRNRPGATLQEFRVIGSLGMT